MSIIFLLLLFSHYLYIHSIHSVVLDITKVLKHHPYLKQQVVNICLHTKFKESCHVPAQIRTLSEVEYFHTNCNIRSHHYITGDCRKQRSSMHRTMHARGVIKYTVRAELSLCTHFSPIR